VLETDFEELSFEEEMRLFKEWGFLLERGPRTDEVTIILEGPTHRSYYVCEPEQLAKMASAILLQRLRISAAMTLMRDLGDIGA
jgi:hypothetical protein